MIEQNPYDAIQSQQIRFKDADADSAWFDTCNDGSVVVTMPYENHDGYTEYRQIELSDTDRVALIAHLQKELTS